MYQWQQHILNSGYRRPYIGTKPITMKSEIRKAENEWVCKETKTHNRPRLRRGMLFYMVGFVLYSFKFSTSLSPKAPYPNINKLQNIVWTENVQNKKIFANRVLKICINLIKKNKNLHVLIQSTSSREGRSRTRCTPTTNKLSNVCYNQDDWDCFEGCTINGFSCDIWIDNYLEINIRLKGFVRHQAQLYTKEKSKYPVHNLYQNTPRFKTRVL